MSLRMLVTATLLVAAFVPSLRGASGVNIYKVPNADFPTIQSAIDIAGPGDRVVVLPGTYVESLVISGKQDFVLRGVGRPVIVSAGAAPALSIVDCVDVNVLNLGIEGGTSHGIDISNTTDVLVRRVTIDGVGGDGIHVDQGNAVRVARSRISSTGRDGISLSADTDGPEADAPSHGSQVQSNRIVDAGRHGIIVNGNDNTIRHNKVFDPQSSGLGVLPGTPSKGNRIERNVVRRALGTSIVAGGQANLVGRNTLLDGEGHGIVVAPVTGYNAVRLNKVLRPKGDGLLLGGVDHQVRVNKVVDAEGNGITVEGTRLGVRGNNVRGSAMNGLFVTLGGNEFVQNSVKQSGGFDLLDVSGGDASILGGNVYEDNGFETVAMIAP